MLHLLLALAQAEDPGVLAIRQRWKSVQADRAAGALYPLAVDANPSHRSYAAIGTYTNTLTCFRAVPEEEPYPSDLPVLVTVSYQVAARSTSTSYLYDAQGELIFAFYEGLEAGTWRLYWQAGELLRAQHEDELVEQLPEAVASLRESGVQLGKQCRELSASEARWRLLE